MLESIGVKANSISLDKYYSSRRTLRLFDKQTTVFVIPKRNLARIGFEWLRVLSMISTPLTYFLENDMKGLAFFKKLKFLFTI